jgi:hypothetical protein
MALHPRACTVAEAYFAVGGRESRDKCGVNLLQVQSLVVEITADFFFGPDGLAHTIVAVAFGVEGVLRTIAGDECLPATHAVGAQFTQGLLRRVLQELIARNAFRMRGHLRRVSQALVACDCAQGTRTRRHHMLKSATLRYSTQPALLYSPCVTLLTLLCHGLGLVCRCSGNAVTTSTMLQSSPFAAAFARSARPLSLMTASTSSSSSSSSSWAWGRTAVAASLASGVVAACDGSSPSPDVSSITPSTAGEDTAATKKRDSRFDSLGPIVTNPEVRSALDKYSAEIGQCVTRRTIMFFPWPVTRCLLFSVCPLSPNL